jgi:hypothetical protein
MAIVFAIHFSFYARSINPDCFFVDSFSLVYLYLHWILALKGKNAKSALRTYLRGLLNRGALNLVIEGDDRTRVEQ